MIYRRVRIGLLSLTPVIAWADLPLTIEDLITDKGKVKLDLSLAYANADRHGISTGDPIIVQTGPTSFIMLPTQIGERIGNSDTAVATFGMRYGLSAKAEVYTRMSGTWSTLRTSGVNGNSTNTEYGFADAWAGINYQFKNDDDHPALLGFVEISLREKHTYSSASFKSAMLGFTTYKAIDPIVLSLTTAYRFNQTRRNGLQDYQPGNLLLLNPSIGFAVNDRVTLTTGMQWVHRQADQFNHQSQGVDRTTTELLLGVGYGFDKNNILNTTLKSNVSGRNGSELRTSWLYTL